MNAPEYEAYLIGRSDVEKKMQMLRDIRQVAKNDFESYSQRSTTALDEARSEERRKPQAAENDTRLYTENRTEYMATKERDENDLREQVLAVHNLNSENAEIQLLHAHFLLRLAASGASSWLDSSISSAGACFLTDDLS